MMFKRQSTASQQADDPWSDLHRDMDHLLYLTAASLVMTLAIFIKVMFFSL